MGSLDVASRRHYDGSGFVKTIPKRHQCTLFTVNHPMKSLIRWALFSLLIVRDATLAQTVGAEIFHAQAELAGEPTAHSVLLQSRLTAIAGPELDDDGDVPGAAGVAAFEWSESPALENARRTQWLRAEAEHDYIVRAALGDLKPGTVYYYRLVYGPTESEFKTGPTRQFKTLPAAGDSRPLAFCMGSCQNYAFFMHGKDGRGASASEQDRRLGYPSYTAMHKLAPDFFIGTGDIVYYDHPAATAAKTLPELRRKWHEQARLPRLVEFFARTPAYWSKDDHDFRFNDADLRGAKLPAPSTGIDVFREQLPIFPAGDRTSPTYRTHRVHTHLQLWFTEGRDYRSPNNLPDGPEKSIWGKEQRAWLETTLAESDATWKIIITPTPMVGPDRNSKKDNHTNLAGFRHEAESFFQKLREQDIQSVLTFCGDRHWQYHSFHPLGVEEFSCGALNDENAIAGERPGGKNTTDPEGLIKQPFLYSEPSGGFLYVTVGQDVGQPARLRIQFRNDLGEMLYETVKESVR
jgi:alkaline phosphatase D